MCHDDLMHRKSIIIRFVQKINSFTYHATALVRLWNSVHECVINPQCRHQRLVMAVIFTEQRYLNALAQVQSTPLLLKSPVKEALSLLCHHFTLASFVGVCTWKCPRDLLQILGDLTFWFAYVCKIILPQFLTSDRVQ